MTIWGSNSGVQDGIANRVLEVFLAFRALLGPRGSQEPAKVSIPSCLVFVSIYIYIYMCEWIQNVNVHNFARGPTAVSEGPGTPREKPDLKTGP